MTKKNKLQKQLEDGKPQKIFIAGYTTLSDAEKIKADKIIEDLKKKGHTIEMGI